MVKRNTRHKTRKHSRKHSKRSTHKHSTHKRRTHRHRRSRGGRGDFTTGASATLAQMAPASFSKLIGAGLAFMNGGK